MPSQSNPDALRKKREGGAEEGTKLSSRARVICQSRKYSLVYKSNIKNEEEN